MKPATARTRTRFENILFATDFSLAAAHAIPFIKKFGGHFQSNLVALHVKPPVVNPMTQPATWPVDVEAAKEFDKEHREELLDTFAGINTDVLIEEGDIQSRLDKAIQEHNTDLVIIGTRGRTGLARPSLRSTKRVTPAEASLRLVAYLEIPRIRRHPFLGHESPHIGKFSFT